MVFEQGFAWWTFGEHAADPSALLREAARIGYRWVDFLPEDLWDEARRRGLGLSVIDGHWPIEEGFNDRTRHRELQTSVRSAIEAAARNGARAVAVSAGDRISGSDDDALKICTEALAPLADRSAVEGIDLLIEPLNTAVDHPEHQCDSTAWARELIETVDSPHLRLLFDCYHVQIMHGDLTRELRECYPLVGHIHVAGVPARREPGADQEVNWPWIARTLDDLAYDGVVSQEFFPTGDPVVALTEAFTVFAGPYRPVGVSDRITAL